MMYPLSLRMSSLRVKDLASKTQSQGPLNPSYPTCSRQEPRATPSKNWWNVSAASSGRMVQGELLTPSAMPMSTEWKAMPVSSTCSREAPPN